ncbi:hypothetical protein ACTA71_003088 [Dictyostelium dimigraforme]
MENKYDKLVEEFKKMETNKLEPKDEEEEQSSEKKVAKTAVNEKGNPKPTPMVIRMAEEVEERVFGDVTRTRIFLKKVKEADQMHSQLIAENVYNDETNWGSFKREIYSYVADNRQYANLEPEQILKVNFIIGGKFNNNRFNSGNNEFNNGRYIVNRFNNGNRVRNGNNNGRYGNNNRIKGSGNNYSQGNNNGNGINNETKGKFIKCYNCGKEGHITRDCNSFRSEYPEVNCVQQSSGKMVKIIPYKRTITAIGVAKLFWYNIVCNYGLPLTIVCDNDKLFTAEIWSQMLEEAGVIMKITVPGRAQSDGQTEGVNGVIKEMLVKMTHIRLKWDEEFKSVEFAINSTINESSRINQRSRDSPNSERSNQPVKIKPLAKTKGE